MRTLHELPQFRDRWSYLDLQRGELDQTATGLVFSNESATTDIPIHQLSLVMLGPGTTVTHAAVKALAGNNCLLAWVGEEGARLYAHSTGGTFSARRLIHQAKVVSDDKLRTEVARRLYAKRFPGDPLDDRSIEQFRGMEGYRVRTSTSSWPISTASSGKGEPTTKTAGTPPTRPIAPCRRPTPSSTGCATRPSFRPAIPPGWGFIHTGKRLSFVYDVADLYKTEVTVPIAFRLAATDRHELERKVRLACRDAFHASRLMDRILPDIAEVLDAGHDLGEIPGELEGRAESLAGPDATGGVRGGPSRWIRDELWDKACKKVKDGVVVQLWTARTEQGYACRQYGLNAQLLIDYEGLFLVSKPLKPKRNAKAQPPQPTGG